MRWVLLGMTAACFIVGAILSAPLGLVGSLLLALLGLGVVLDDGYAIEPPDDLAVLRASVEREPSWMPAVNSARELYMQERITQEEFLKRVEDADKPPPRPTGAPALDPKYKPSRDEKRERIAKAVRNYNSGPSNPYRTMILESGARAVWQREGETLYDRIPSYRELTEAERKALGVSHIRYNDEFDVDRPPRSDYASRSAYRTAEQHARLVEARRKQQYGEG